jgi:hypothetical protein
MWNLKSKLHRLAFQRHESGKRRISGFYLAAVLGLLVFAGVARAQYGQYPLLDAAANKVIQKYQYSSCEQLWEDRNKPKTQREQEAVNFLRNDPHMRQMFIDRVAAPVANKLFQCGMIP